MKKFCGHCLKEVSCKYYEKGKELFVDNKNIKYLEKYYICNECHNKFYDDLHDYNIHTINSELRILNNIITIDEIKGIMKKYNIDEKTLSLVLGFKENTITRYLEGRNPSKENSELLKNIDINPLLYEIYLVTNKGLITPIAFKKSMEKLELII